MKRKFSAVLVLVLVLSMVMTACGSDSSSGADDAQTGEDEWAGSVAMVLPGLITDKAFNQFTYEGMVRAAEETGIKTAYMENVTQDAQVEVLRQFAQQGYEIVIGQGGQFGEAVSVVAAEYPDTQFIFSVGTDTYDLPNMSAATVSYSHAGFVGGVLAALTTKTNKVAMVTGEWYDPHRQMEESFYKGVAYVNPDIETTAITTGDWADTVKAREASLALIAQGYDVLFPCLDAAGAGVAAAAQDSENVWIVGAVADYAVDYGAADVTVGSAVFSWEGLGYLESTGALCDGQAHVIGMADGGIDPVVNVTLTEEQQAIYDQAIADLTAGNLDIAD
jgi:basic membrane protein A